MKLNKLIIQMLLSPLVLLLASPSLHAYSSYYYVIPTSVALRECPGPECDTLLTVYQGDRVEILERTSTGWSKVRLADRAAAMGWIPSNLLSYSPDRKMTTMPTYYVNTSSVNLMDKPRPDAGVLTTLYFNDPVEMLGVGTSGWAQVRDLRSNVIGYVPPRYLSATSPSQPKFSRPRRAPSGKAAPKKEKPPAETPASPSAM
jgi:uncharacterized protein YgiM (DUF1202 family)